jgi:hypothetical protein
MADGSVLIVHVASGSKSVGNQDEAEDHASRLSAPHDIKMPSKMSWYITEDQERLYRYMDPSPQGTAVAPNWRQPEIRTISILTVDDFVRELQKFQQDRAEIVYLDFHTHGGPGGLDLGGETFDIDDLDKLRNKGFEGLFVAGALINFLGCELAGYQPSINIQNDGELFLAEFAPIFLMRYGGRAVGRSTPWIYRHLQVAFFGPMFSAWKTDGAEIVAEVAPGASRAVLKGNYWLDEVRIRRQINALRGYLEKRLQTLRSQQPPLQSEDLRQIYDGALKQLEFAEAPLRAPSPLSYRSLHQAVVKIEDVQDLVRKKGAPWEKWWF